MRDVMEQILAEVREALENPDACDRTYVLESVEEQLAGLLEHRADDSAAAVTR